MFNVILDEGKLDINLLGIFIIFLWCEDVKMSEGIKLNFEWWLEVYFFFLML